MRCNECDANVGEVGQRLEVGAPQRVLERGFGEEADTGARQHAVRVSKNACSAGTLRFSNPASGDHVLFRTIPCLISSRMIAGTPMSSASACARIDLPDPGGPLTTAITGAPGELAIAKSGSSCLGAVLQPSKEVGDAVSDEAWESEDQVLPQIRWPRPALTPTSS